MDVAAFGRKVIENVERVASGLAIVFAVRAIGIAPVSDA